MKTTLRSIKLHNSTISITNDAKQYCYRNPMNISKFC